MEFEINIWCVAVAFMTFYVLEGHFKIVNNAIDVNDLWIWTHMSYWEEHAVLKWSANNNSCLVVIHFSGFIHLGIAGYPRNEREQEVQSDSCHKERCFCLLWYSSHQCRWTPVMTCCISSNNSICNFNQSDSLKGLGFYSTCH